MRQAELFVTVLEKPGRRREMNMEIMCVCTCVCVCVCVGVCMCACRLMHFRGESDRGGEKGREKVTLAL